MEGSATTGDVARIGRCNINYSSELSGEARVNLPLELSLPAGLFCTMALTSFRYVIYLNFLLFQTSL